MRTINALCMDINQSNDQPKPLQPFILKFLSEGAAQRYGLQRDFIVNAKPFHSDQAFVPFNCVHAHKCINNPEICNAASVTLNGAEGRQIFLSFSWSTCQSATRRQRSRLVVFRKQKKWRRIIIISLETV